MVNYYNENMHNCSCNGNRNGSGATYQGRNMGMLNNENMNQFICNCAQNSSTSGAPITPQHGLVEMPLSRAAKCVNYKTEVDYAYAFQQCGAVIDNSGGLEALKGFPESGPRDGEIASAGGKFGGVLDEQTAERWWKNPLDTGKQQFTWNFHAPHSTDKFEYFITNPDWDPNQKLTRASFNLTPIHTEYYNGQVPPTNVSHIVPIPEYYCGYHIILAVWTVADTPNAFYNVIDLCLHPRRRNFY
ncbi:lytic polysaccharide monooxygenase [Bacillus thuringiensis]|uniref:lytic polysaccharide monooxygenase n=1 Tax=Bacillus thuringiensis TaxID=1428 RepID=UPI000E4CE58F|nr:lytic polysaccharide monooxygenase [Bacillus thuringiensis]MDZ3952410.1 lytic polysaccharide monooxygenase [Bacillus thuringiensis]RGP45230.1 hypothetical protein BTW32_26065 [Bacillus thuringiensis]